jgi:SPP1 family predicted phage head-tail adaptor
MKAIDPGRLNKRVRLLRPERTQDAAGQPVTTWVLVVTAWAEVLPLRSVERLAAASVQQENTLKIRIRRRTDVDGTWRLEYEGRGYDITGVLPYGPAHTELWVLQGIKDGR